jgi:hypothetical protein
VSRALLFSVKIAFQRIHKFLSASIVFKRSTVEAILLEMYKKERDISIVILSMSIGAVFCVRGNFFQHMIMKDDMHN